MGEEITSTVVDEELTDAAMDEEVENNTANEGLSGTILNKRIDVYIALLTSFTNQIEDYEKRNYDECMKCIAFIGVLLTIVCAFFSIEGMELETKNMSIRYISSFVPIIITIFIYNFAMNCRRSAVLRGYTQFLEERINVITNENAMMYNGPVFSEEIANFPVNKYGPCALGPALIALYGISLGCLIAVFETGFWEVGWTGLIKSIVYHIIPWILSAISLVVCFHFFIALTRNNEAVKRTKKLCDDVYTGTAEDTNES